MSILCQTYTRPDLVDFIFLYVSARFVEFDEVYSLSLEALTPCVYTILNYIYITELIAWSVLRTLSGRWRTVRRNCCWVISADVYQLKSLPLLWHKITEHSLRNYWRYRNIWLFFDLYVMIWYDVKLVTLCRLNHNQVLHTQCISL